MVVPDAGGEPMVYDPEGRPFEAALDVGDDAVVVTFRGEFDLAAEQAASAALAEAFPAVPESIVVDLRDLSFMDSTGIRCLIRAKSRADTLGRQIALLNGSGPAHRVFQLAGVDDRLEVADHPRR
jgi:anti-anti-sigma factor